MRTATIDDLSSVTEAPSDRVLTRYVYASANSSF